MGDLYPPGWEPANSCFAGAIPTEPEVSHEIQMAFYGHVIDQKYGRPA